MWSVELATDAFLPYLPEEAQANPGVYGFELADWLARGLALRGITTSYPMREDWGWLIEHRKDDGVITIGCASLSDPGEGYLGKPIGWRIFVDCKSSSGWLRRRTSTIDSGPIESAIESILAAAGHAFTPSDETAQD
ncbi:MAG: hypothetical protein AB7O57_05205 [Hyphomicrobiaceae bacterium]